MSRGVLVLVVGPSGAGKDTLIGSARDALRDDHRFHFPRRVITRDAVIELEDHDTVDADEFARQKQQGAYALDWEAHGLCYGVPAAIQPVLAAGLVVVVNGSRGILAEAQQKFPTSVLLITASPEVRTQRLLARGRENAAEVGERLAREGALVPPGIIPTVIDNSGSLARGVAEVVGALRRLAG